jgi:hypothetical protein
MIKEKREDKDLKQKNLHSRPPPPIRSRAAGDM